MKRCAQSPAFELACTFIVFASAMPVKATKHGSAQNRDSASHSSPPCLYPARFDWAVPWSPTRDKRCLASAEASAHCTNNRKGGAPRPTTRAVQPGYLQGKESFSADITTSETAGASRFVKSSCPQRMKALRISPSVFCFGGQIPAPDNSAFRQRRVSRQRNRAGPAPRTIPRR